MRTSRMSRSFVLALIACIGTLPLRAENEASNGAAETVSAAAEFGSWRIVCPEGASCRLSQTIVAGAERAPLVVARAFKAPEAVLVLSVPPGIYLAPGLALKVGKGKSRRYPFETCDADGCHTGLKLDTPLLKDFAAGTEAAVSFFDGTQQVVTAVLSLNGFAKGYEAMK